MLAAAPDALFGRLWDAFFAGSLPALTSGPISNFVVQAALASARTGSQVSADTHLIRRSAEGNRCLSDAVLGKYTGCSSDALLGGRTLMLHCGNLGPSPTNHR